MNSCQICQSNRLTPLYNNTLLRCETCTHIRANMEVSAEKLAEIYSENYFKGEEYADYLADKIILQQNFAKRLQSIRQLNPVPSYKQVLEIGCAYGFFAELFRNQNPHAAYLGIDLAEEAVSYGKNTLHQPLESGDYLQLQAPENSYSDVFMWDVIEHLPNPELFIQKIAAETQSGSRIYITTGDIGSRLATWQKNKWRMIHPPTHLHYFTRQSLKILLSHYGFEEERVSYPPVSRSLKVIFYSLFMLNKKYGSLVKKLYESIPEKASISVNTYDIMFFTARKK